MSSWWGGVSFEDNSLMIKKKMINRYSMSNYGLGRKSFFFLYYSLRRIFVFGAIGFWYRL